MILCAVSNPDTDTECVLPVSNHGHHQDDAGACWRNDAVTRSEATDTAMPRRGRSTGASPSARALVERISGSGRKP
jgi:hypothetical protein